MIVKRNFNLRSVCWYIRYECLASLAWSMAVYGTYRLFDLSLHLPFSVAGILGSALAIFIAFRNQSSYARWWEARTIWGGIVNNSRILARQMIANVNQAIATGKVTEPEGARYKKEMIDRQIAFAHALRLHLRKETAWDVLQPFLTETEYRFVQHTSNRPNTLLLQQGIRIREAMQLEFLGAFDNISLEPTLAGFNNFQGACERIKNTPLLRQYHFFTKLFLFVFMTILPFSLISDFNKMGVPALMIPLSTLLSFVFGVMGKVGEVNEDPFENRITDIPMSAMCITIERDLKEMLGETDFPQKLTSKDGFLF